MNKEQETALEVLDTVLDMFASRSLKPKMPVKRKLHRCLNCNKVTKYIFCPKCAKERLKR